MDISTLKDGFYIKLINPDFNIPSIVRRETFEEIEQAIDHYKKYDFQYLGQLKKGEWVETKNDI